jgi:thiazole synthase
MKDKPLKIGKYTFSSRLFVGTGKYDTFPLMVDALEASGTEVVTVAVRRVNLSGEGESLLDYIDRDKYTLLPNTAGCFSADDVIRTALMAREAGLSDLIKVEVLGDKISLLPDIVDTLEAVKVLVKEGFTIWVYTSDDPILACRLEDAGVAAVMPLGSPIGSGQGILNRTNLHILLQNVKVPVIIDAGVGTASDVSIAMELGAEGVLLNTGIALAKDPVRMAKAMKHACIAGREAFLAGRIPKKEFGSPSSPVEGLATS